MEVLSLAAKGAWGGGIFILLDFFFLATSTFSLEIVLPFLFVLFFFFSSSLSICLRIHVCLISLPSARASFVNYFVFVFKVTKLERLSFISTALFI